jgi:CubicO group peptidase (beta-lactamase class C family)
MHITLQANIQPARQRALSHFAACTCRAWAHILCLLVSSSLLVPQALLAADGLDTHVEAEMAKRRIPGLALAVKPLSSAPGERFQYSDVGYFLLGMVIENITGQRCADFLNERFFQPLGMLDPGIPDQ